MSRGIDEEFDPYDDDYWWDAANEEWVYAGAFGYGPPLSDEDAAAMLAAHEKMRPNRWRRLRIWWRDNVYPAQCFDFTCHRPKWLGNHDKCIPF